MADMERTMPTKAETIARTDSSKEGKEGESEAVMSGSDESQSRFQKMLELLWKLSPLGLALGTINFFVNTLVEAYEETQRLDNPTAEKYQNELSEVGEDAANKLQNASTKEEVEEIVNNGTKDVKGIQQEMNGIYKDAIEQVPIQAEAEIADVDFELTQNSKGEFVEIDSSYMELPPEIQERIVEVTPTVEEDNRFQDAIRDASDKGATNAQIDAMINDYSETIDAADPESCREARSKISATIEEANRSPEPDYSDVLEKTNDISNNVASKGSTQMSKSEVGFGLANDALNSMGNVKQFEDDPIAAEQGMAQTTLSTTKHGYYLVANIKQQVKDSHQGSFNLNKEEKEFEKEMTEQSKEFKTQLQELEQQVGDGKLEGLHLAKDENGKDITETVDGQKGLKIDIGEDTIEMQKSKTETGKDTVSIKLNGKESSIDDVTKHFEDKTRDSFNKSKESLSSSKGSMTAGIDSISQGAKGLANDKNKGMEQGAADTLKGGLNVAKGLGQLLKKLLKMMKELIKQGIKTGMKAIPYVNIISTAIEMTGKAVNFGRDSAKSMTKDNRENVR